MKALRASPFPYSHEAWNLALPLFFLLLTLAEFSFGSIALGENGLVALSLLAATHHLATIPIVAGSQPLRGWLARFSLGMPILWGGLFLALFACFFLGLQKSAENHYPIYLFLFYFMAFDFYFVSTFHMINQQKGISLLYNKHGAAALSGVDAKRLEKWASLERKATLGLLLCVVAGTIFLGKGISHRHFEWRAVPLPAKGFLLGACVAAGFLVLSAHQSAKLLRSGKGVFAWRMMIWPLYPISIAAQAGTRIIHGVEYYFVYAKIRKDRPAGGRGWKPLAVLSLLAYGAVLTFRHGGFMEYLGNHDWLHQRVFGAELGVYAFSLYGAANMLHIIVDSLIFRMRHPIPRQETMRPLLARGD